MSCEDVEDLVQRNAKLVEFVMQIMRKAPEVRLEPDALRSAALWGLYRAAKAHDPSRGKYSTCAVWYARTEVVDEIRRMRGSKTRQKRKHHSLDEESLAILDPTDLFDGYGRMNELLECLTPKQLDCVQLYYGFHGDPLTLREIGEKYGLTRQRIRQILEKSYEKLRKHARKKQLILQDDQVVRAGA